MLINFIMLFWHIVCKTTTLKKKTEKNQIPCFRFDVKKTPKVKTFPLQHDPEHTSNIHHHCPGSAWQNQLMFFEAHKLHPVIFQWTKTAVKTVYLWRSAGHGDFSWKTILWGHTSFKDLLESELLQGENCIVLKISKLWEMKKEGKRKNTENSETGVEGHWSIEALINGLFLAELQREKKPALAQQWHSRLQDCISDYHTIARTNYKVPTFIITLGHTHLAVLL